jgi:hypothetical protein
MKYGPRYKEAIAATGLDYQTLRNSAVVARRFAPSRRRDNLSFQHHAEVCALSDDDQDLWLDVAAMRGWSKRDLRRHIRAGNDAAPTRASSSVLGLTVDSGRDHPLAPCRRTVRFLAADVDRDDAGRRGRSGARPARARDKPRQRRWALWRSSRVRRGTAIAPLTGRHPSLKRSRPTGQR